MGAMLGALLCVLAGAAGAAQAANPIHLVTYEGTYSYHEHDTGQYGDSDFTDTLTWTMKAYWDSETGTVTLSLIAQGLHASAGTRAFVNNVYHCA